MDASQTYQSRFLAKTDFEQPRRLTILDTEMYEVGDNGEEKPGVTFEALERPMIFNRSNWSVLIEAFGKDTEAWRGKVVIVGVDPNIRYAGKKVGGLVVRIPQPAAKKAPPAAVPTGQVDDDGPDIMDDAGFEFATKQIA